MGSGMGWWIQVQINNDAEVYRKNTERFKESTKQLIRDIHFFKLDDEDIINRLNNILNEIKETNWK